MEIVRIKIAELKEYEGNAKIHTEKQIQQLVTSIEKFGFNDPIGVWRDNTVIEGHGRLIALKRLGYEEVDCIRLDHLTDEERRAYTLVHNTTNLLTGLDDVLVQEELLKLINSDMEVFGLKLNVDETAGVQEDEYTVTAALSRVKLGEVWQLGVHRLVCGDSTSPEVVRSAMGGGIADCVMTDPPYNVDYQGGTKDALKICNDAMSDDEFGRFLKAAFVNMRENLKDGGAFYVWLASRTHIAFETALRYAGLGVRQQLIWVKNALILGRSDYQWRHEPCLYGWKEGAAHYFLDDRTQTTVQESDEVVNPRSLKKDELVKYAEELTKKLNDMPSTIIREDKPIASEEHPTMKPIRLLARLIANSTKPGEVVLDPFGGSGSTLIACEQLGRVCVMVELDEKYASVIVDRWEKYTGKTAERIRG